MYGDAPRSTEQADAAADARDDRARALAHALQEAGASRIEARLVAELLVRQEADTGTLLHATELRQPEVSTGMRQLRERGWVATQAAPSEGRGRPMHVHRLAVSPDDIQEFYQHVVETRIASEQRALSAMREALDQVSLDTPSGPARRTASHRPRNRPHSTTPG